MKMPMDQKLMIANKLRELRELNGYTQSELGRILGRAYTTVASWESGKGQPDADTLLRILALYNVEDVLSEFGYAKPGAPLSKDERVLVDNYRLAPPHVRELILNLVVGLSTLITSHSELPAAARGDGDAQISLSPAQLKKLEGGDWPGDNQ